MAFALCRSAYAEAYALEANNRREIANNRREISKWMGGKQ